jgi:outer membrane murein-binding lipoprotein Lpp
VADIKVKLDVLATEINTLNKDWQAATAKEKKKLGGEARELNIQLTQLNTDIDKYVLTACLE